MNQEALFPGSEPTPQHEPKPPAGGRPRFQAPLRTQGEWLSGDLDSLVGSEHRVRLVWAFVESLDLQPFYGRIRSVESAAGRPPIDPAILMALWLYATTEGVGSARALAKLCTAHDAYRWICGGVSVNYHTLSDFRTAHGGRLDVLLTQSVAALMDEGIVDLERVSQDGIKTRASAGASSFRGKEKLKECLRQAKEQVETLKRELTEDPAATTVRQAAARTRAARERAERIQRAIAAQEEVERQRQSEEEKKKARASTTDADARVMKTPDGGYRPGFNTQLATDTRCQIVVGVEVNNRGNDFGQLDPMLEQIKSRYGKRPPQALVDGGYVSMPEIETVTSGGTRIYAPTRVKKTTKNPLVENPHLARPTDSKAVGDWRVRMGTPEAKEIYKERASTSECVNALARNRGLRQFVVRGIEKVRAVTLWFALAHNLLRAASLRAGVPAVA
jgi:transposase